VSSKYDAFWIAEEGGADVDADAEGGELGFGADSFGHVESVGDPGACIGEQGGQVERTDEPGLGRAEREISERRIVRQQLGEPRARVVLAVPL
jgi:hypothetical protein